MHSAVKHQTNHSGKKSYVASTHGGDLASWEQTVKESQIRRKLAFVASQNYSRKEVTTPVGGVVVVWLLVELQCRILVGSLCSFFLFNCLSYYLPYFLILSFCMCFVTVL